MPRGAGALVGSRGRRPPAGVPRVPCGFRRRRQPPCPPRPCSYRVAAPCSPRASSARQNRRGHAQALGAASASCPGTGTAPARAGETQNARRPLPPARNARHAAVPARMEHALDRARGATPTWRAPGMRRGVGRCAGRCEGLVRVKECSGRPRCLSRVRESRVVARARRKRLVGC